MERLTGGVRSRRHPLPMTTTSSAELNRERPRIARGLTTPTGEDLHRLYEGVNTVLGSWHDVELATWTP